MPNQSSPLDQVFQALADPTRRAVVERLTCGPATTTELAQPFSMALPSFAQHMGMLERCGLVRSHKTGRIRTYHLVPRRLKAAEQWMSRQRALWEQRLDQLDAFLLSQKENPS
ncbi:ArsR/SmtB family transcription factor [Tahibacter amnicola]|uniref:Metalloregulator ArsR/SmtB family transcription factor n=1 Tax=Tahibacter amnicola TaxID=2976241 RepID=A0ABY6BEX8_9GAMM|nr:metalloregulator ArsR/SmtB family transcription factor [Tahibacter amnicola]UXI66447.1 metalloregulator ArsR/SmtB family transcription factor [Tahibacter amnicola]